MQEKCGKTFYGIMAFPSCLLYDSDVWILTENVSINVSRHTSRDGKRMCYSQNNLSTPTFLVNKKIDCIHYTERCLNSQSDELNMHPSCQYAKTLPKDSLELESQFIYYTHYGLLTIKEMQSIYTMNLHEKSMLTINIDAAEYLRIINNLIDLTLGAEIMSERTHIF